MTKRTRAWVLAAAFSTSLLMRPSEAHAFDEGPALPFMVMAAAFTVTIIVIAVNNPTDGDTDAGGSSTPAADDTAPSQDALRRAPVQNGPKQFSPVFGFRGRF